MFHADKIIALSALLFYAFQVLPFILVVPGDLLQFLRSFPLHGSVYLLLAPVFMLLIVCGLFFQKSALLLVALLASIAALSFPRPSPADRETSVHRSAENTESAQEYTESVQESIDDQAASVQHSDSQPNTSDDIPDNPVNHTTKPMVSLYRTSHILPFYHFFLLLLGYSFFRIPLWHLCPPRAVTNIDVGGHRPVGLQADQKTESH